MNPAFRIWAIAIGSCTVSSILLSSELAVMWLILLIVVAASLVSLLGFYLLYELLRHLKLEQPSIWIYSILGTISIVAFNALCLLYFIGGNGSAASAWSLFVELFPVILIPMAGSLIGSLISYRRINDYCSKPEEAYYPDACI